jgi:enoyl-CoA hydratase/carnithine racemase
LADCEVDELSYDDFEMLQITLEAGVARATLSNPPMNVMTLPLFGELLRFGQRVGDDDDVRVVVLKSADPDFFIAHFDVAAILEFPMEGEPVRNPNNVFHQMCERYRTMEKVTIAQIEGRVGGGGSELVQGFDMRFGVVGRTRFNQMEVSLGILPGGSGTQRLPRLMGRARALEMILGGQDIDAETAERWGLLNRALPADEIDDFVDALARRIASFPAEAVRFAKRAVDLAEGPLAEGLIEEGYLFDTLTRSDAARRNMRRFLELGGQTREAELDIEALIARVAES